ncbi:MAG: DUF262 domain-containing protein [Rikenellaceae bacterium]|nr:DUF262 domain-containing protein [Rikenellaceae bacterium]
MAEINNSSQLADKLFPDIHNEDIDILNIPPEKRRLNTETYDFTVSTLYDYVQTNHIMIPQFQRGYVWNKAQASRLIESLIINCPIPVIYLSQNPDETLSVIDGNQRINSIKLFLNDEYDLKGLSAYPELGGYKFSDLDPRFQRHILNRTIRCIVILKDTHPQIKFDVFERLNTGSVKLTAHELRHGINTGPLMNATEELAKNKLFRELTLMKADKRMKADELVVRFFALAANWRGYVKPLVAFLNTYCETHRYADAEYINNLTMIFERTITTVNALLGKMAFKTYDNAQKNAKFNAALYDAQMLACYELNLSEADIDRLKSQNFPQKNQEFISDDKFYKYIASATTDKNSVTNRIQEYKLFIQSLLA